MGMWDNVLLALQALKANKMRALLTMLGIIIGIGSVIAIFTVGDSLTGTINESMQDMGMSNITVTLTARDDDDEDTTSSLAGGMSARMFVSSSPSEDDLITDEMIAEFKSDLGSRVKAVSIAESIGTATVSVDGTSDTLYSTTSGISADYPSVNDINLLYGRFPTEDDGTKRICVVSDYLVNYFYGIGEDGVGKPIYLNIQGNVLTFYICGVYEYEESIISSMTSSSSSTENTPIYTNLALSRQLNHSDEGYQTFTVVANANENATEFMEVVEDYFESFYTHNTSYTVQCSNLESIVDSVTEMLDKVSIAIAAIAAISLLVGGIGVMNIMLVSITERTREIGTRKALGAPNTAIRLQFITESVVICLVGGIIGIIFGLVLASIATNILGYAAKPTASAIIIACGFSMAIGVFFGYYPANKAAKLDPIDALRYE